MSEAPGVSLRGTNHFYFHPWQNLQSQHLSSDLWIPSIGDVSPSPQLGYSVALLLSRLLSSPVSARDLCPDQSFLGFFFFLSVLRPEHLHLILRSKGVPSEWKGCLLIVI